MKILHFSPIGIHANGQQEYRWNKTESDCPPHLEAEIRECFARAKDVAFSHIRNDNRTDQQGNGWSKDLDPNLGRAMFEMNTEKVDCLLGAHITPTIMVEYSPESGGAQALELSCKENNFRESVRWNLRGVESVKSERHLKDGSRENLSIQVDSERGTLLLITQLAPSVS